MHTTPDRRFAITIPCYMSERTIAETLIGVMNQGQALERVACIIIADDASPDRTLEVVKNTWCLPHPPIRLEIREKNVGEMANVNSTVGHLPDEVEWFLHMHGDNIPKREWLST